MISLLADYTPRVAMGILARTALDLDDDQGDDAPVTREENGLRLAILKEVRGSLGLAFDDESPNAIEKVTDALDKELDNIGGKVDVNDVLRQLSDSGKLPSDLYQVTIIPNVQDLYKKDWLEMSQAIVKTIRKADKEQHFGHEADDETPVLVSLFSKFYPNKIITKSFTLLVVGQREGLQFTVHQAWCIYPDTLPFQESKTLLDLFELLANTYGMEFEIGGVVSKFQLKLELQSDLPPIQQLQILPITKIDSRGRKKEVMPSRCMWSMFTVKVLTGKHISSLVVAFNLDKYSEMLKNHR